MELLPPTPEAIAHAADILRSGGLVAFPTETVYGLGANARDPVALARIFAAKGRPSEHPLIVHLPGADALPAWAASVPRAAQELAAAFWPGPLTLVLKRAPGVPDAVTGGQDTVGLRVPGHEVALALLFAFGDGVAAPSANRFGRISPTRPAHVLAELGDRVDLILDGGPTELGLESTILDLSGLDEGGAARVLRPGGVAVAALAAVLGYRPEVVRRAGVRASGTLPSHYAPQTPAVLVASAQAAAGVGVIARRAAPPGAAGVWLELPEDAAGYARALYAALRELDALGLSRILVEAVPESEDWLAVRDRLRRATARVGREP